VESLLRRAQKEWADSLESPMQIKAKLQLFHYLVGKEISYQTYYQYGDFIQTIFQLLGYGILVFFFLVQVGEYLERKQRHRTLLEIVPISNKEELLIKTPSLHQEVKNLSGGNQQKVVLAKWLAANSEVIIFDEPTRGIDVGAKYEIYKLINRLVESGKSVLLISSEMEELIGMSDRILVLAEGEITGALVKDEFDQTAIMKLAAGMEMGEFKI